jgi:hypothetical protein
MSIIKQTSSGNTTLYATAANNMGTILGKMQRHNDALPYLYKAYELRKELLGPRHLETAQTAASIGGTLNWLDRCGYVVEASGGALPSPQSTHVVVG